MTEQEQAWGGPLWPAADLITPMALRVAATLRIADAIAVGVTSGPALAARLAVAADPLIRVLDHLVTAGFLGRDQDGDYRLTGAGEWLCDDHPEGVRAAIDLEGAIGHADISMVELLHTVRTGKPAFDRHFGHGFWQDLTEHPDRAASFDALMGRQENDAPSVAAAYDWSQPGRGHRRRRRQRLAADRPTPRPPKAPRNGAGPRSTGRHRDPSAGGSRSSRSRPRADW